MDNRPATLRSRRVCRFCLTEAEPLSFIYDRELTRPFQVPLSLQIMSCVAIEVYSADGMPQMICHHCRSNLDRCYRFKLQCKKADEALRNYPVSGVLPRPFPPITSESGEPSLKRTHDPRPTNDQVKKSRLDNGERQVQRQIETRASQMEKQQREKQTQEMYEEEEMHDEQDDRDKHKVNNVKDDSKLEPGEIRVHACNQCERTFPLLQSLQLHIQRAHRDRDYKCTECDRMFFSKYDLTKHMTTHSEEKPYSCQICQKQFSRANLLQRHEKVHRDELRYGCPECDREFFTPEELEKHEEAVHKVPKPFQCNICNKRFTYKQGLERHEMLHNDDKTFVCEYCKEAFRTSTKLARHLTTHAGHRPYVCKLCPRTFLLSHHLTRHMRTHSVEKNHQCEECGKAFKRKESLDVHMLTHIKRPGMNLTCPNCHESCRNRADYVTHIKQHIEAGEKMGPDGLPPENKDKIGETESEEEEEEEEEPYSDGDDDYQPPAYLYKKGIPRVTKAKAESEEERMEAEEKNQQVVYVKNKDGLLVKKTIKTLMPIQRRNEPQQVQEVKKTISTGSPQVVTAKEAPPKGRVDDTEVQVQKIVASVFKEHKIPLKHQGPEQTKDLQPIPRQGPCLTPTIIKEEKLETPLTKSGNTVRVIKRIVVRKPVGSADSGVITGPLREFVQEATQPPLATPSTSGPKVTKRVIVRRIIRQGDTTREVIMNPDGTIIDPAELAKLPTGNVVKRVVVKKPLEKGQNIEAMLQCADAKQIMRLAESGEDIIKASSLIPMPKPTVMQKPEPQPQPQPQKVQVENVEELKRTIELQSKRIEELQAENERKAEFDAGDDMLPERHDESEDEQQLPLKRVFVKRNKSIYDEEKEYAEENDNEEIVQDEGMKDVPSEEMVESTTNLDEAKIIIIKPEDSQPDVDEMSRELCDILESTDSVVKMQENVLSNLEQITNVNETTVSHDEIHEVTEEEDQGQVPQENLIEEPMDQEEVVADEVQNPHQVEEEVNEQHEDPTIKIIITQSEEDGVKLELEETAEADDQIESVTETTVDRTESGLSTLSTQVLSDSNNVFETSDTAMEVEVEKGQEQSNLDESVIELSESDNTINLNETADSRDSLEDKLSQMHG